MEQTALSEVQQTAVDETRIREMAILEALASGTPYREIAQAHKVSIATLSRVAQRMDDLDTGAVAKLMQSRALEMIDVWGTAAIVGATQGKHAAARDWLTHSKALEPVHSDVSTGAKVAILIGMPGQPVSSDTSQVIEVQALTVKDES